MATGPVARRLQHGAAAEDLACRYLEGQGLRPVLRNFRCRFGELDLVMREGAVLVVVEVRSRRRIHVTTPASTVTVAKQRRLVGATRYLLVRFRQYAALPVRFDVVEVRGELDAPDLRWYRAAFTADGMAGR